MKYCANILLEDHTGASSFSLNRNPLKRVERRMWSFFSFYFCIIWLFLMVFVQGQFRSIRVYDDVNLFYHKITSFMRVPHGHIIKSKCRREKMWSWKLIFAVAVVNYTTFLYNAIHMTWVKRKARFFYSNGKKILPTPTFFLFSVNDNEKALGIKEKLQNRRKVLPKRFTNE